MRRLALAFLALLLAFPASALAHVTIVPDTSRPGQTGEFRLRTQNERENSATVRLEVFIPKGVPAEAVPVKGWTITRIPGGLRWAADQGVAIRGGRTEDFKLKLGPLPKQPRLVFKALQYYEDGQVVRWIQDPTADAERPAALLDLGGGALRDENVAAGGESNGFPWAIVVAVLVLAAIVAAGAVTLRRRSDI
jgi:uncharacterized protein YcnI